MDKLKRSMHDSKHKGTMRMASFDIGKKNFCFYVEELNYDNLTKLKDVNEDKYNIDGTTTPEMTNLLHKIYKNGKTILHENVDLTYNCEKVYLDPELFHNMNDVLDKYADIWKTCDIIIIEQQMSFGRRKSNTMAMKLGQHCYSYFTIKHGRDKVLIEFPSYHKTQILGAPKDQKTTKKGKITWKSMSDSLRKRWWAPMQAYEVLTCRNEQNILDKIKSKKKKDDLCDTILQLQAAKYLLFVNK